MRRMKLFSSVGHTWFIILTVAIICALTALISGCSLFDNLVGGNNDDDETLHTHSLSHTQKKEPTCTEEGNIEYWYCSDCGKYFSDSSANNEISKSSLKIPVEHTLEYMYYVNATCIYSGHMTYYKCEICDATFWDEDGQEPMDEKDAELEPTGIHSWNDNVCTDCKTDGGGSKGLEWTHNDGYYSVKGIGTCKDEDIVLPSTYNGEPVTKIGDEAFWGCYSFNSLTIPDSVTEIGKYAFVQCGVKEITLGSGIEKIDESAFSQCFRIEKVNVKDFADWCSISFGIYGNPLLASDALLYIDGEPVKDGFEIPEGITAIPEYTFKNIPLTSMTIPDSVQSIGSGAFAYCYNLTKLKLPFACKLSNLFSASATWIEEVEITGGDSIPDEAFYYCMALTKLILPESISSIGERAFYKCENIESLTLPNAVNIGADAFNGCKNLVSLNNTDNLTSLGAGAFNGCENLNGVTIPSTLKSIGDNTFKDCKNLENITIPETVTSIGANAFSGCEKLESVTIPETVTSIGASAFAQCVNLKEVYFNAVSCSTPSFDKAMFNGCKAITTLVIGESVKSIPNAAFAYCSGLKGVTIEGNIESIGDYAFYYCQLEDIDLPESLETIGGYAFGTNLMSSLTIPSGVTEIGDYAFSNIYLLESLTLPDTLTTLGEGAFLNARGIESLIIPENLTEISDRAFGGLSKLKTVNWNAIDCINTGECKVGIFEGCPLLEEVTFGDEVTNVPGCLLANCTAITSILLPQTVTSLDKNAFYGCTNLESINLPAKLSSIGGGVFYGCEKLDEITIPERLGNIGDNAFYGCVSIKSVTIPYYVRDIGESAFYGCSSLESVYYNSSSCYFVGSESHPAFANCPLLTTLVFGKEVYSIPDFAFMNCTSLTSVTIPASVDKIGRCAFYGCENLVSVKFENTQGWYYKLSTVANAQKNPLSSSIVESAVVMAGRLKSITHKNDYFFREDN